MNRDFVVFALLHGRNKTQQEIYVLNISSIFFPHLAWWSHLRRQKLLRLQQLGRLTRHTDHLFTPCNRISLSPSDSRAPSARGLWEYKDWNAPVSLILSLSPCRCPTASRLNQISPSSHSFRVVGCGLYVPRLLHWLFLLPLFTLCLWISTCIPQQQMTYHIPLKLLSGI